MKAPEEGRLQIDETHWPRLSAHFDRALEIEPQGRSELFSAVRAESVELASALERLLRDHDAALASRFLAEPLDDTSAPTLAGREFGPYTLVRPIGAGGMGTVWRARRSDGRFDKDVAVKLLNLAMLDRAGEERFRREGMLLARLDHPNIARLLDAGVSVAGQPYLVLELVEGELLDAHAATQRLGVRERLELFAQVADAVAHAHANLVVHRDLKPSNILVDTAGRVKLLDFGVSSLLDEASGLAVSRTHTLGRALTPAYAAPEQIEGGSVTTATDVYALGVLLYELLTGVHPTGARGATPAALARTLAEVEPERASAAVSGLSAGDPGSARLLSERSTSRERLTNALRGDLDNILAKALRKRPGDRYATAAAFGDDVRRHLLDLPVQARSESAAYRVRKFVARHRLEVGSAVAVFLALAVGTALALLQARTSARERDRALAELRLAVVTNDLAAFLLSESTPEGKSATKAELLARGEEMIERRYANDPGLRVRLLLSLSDRYLENAQLDSWHRTVANAYELSLSVDDVRLHALAACNFAMTAVKAGKFESAEAMISEALRSLGGSRESAMEEVECRLVESVSALFMGDFSRAIQASERALMHERSRSGLARRERDALYVLSEAYRLSGRKLDADRTFHELVALLEAQGLYRTKDAALYLANWALMLCRAGQTAQSLEVFERSIALTRELHGAWDAQWWALRMFAGSLSDSGRHEEALATMDEALRKARLEGSIHEVVWTLGTGTRVHFNAGRFEAGETLLRELEALVLSDPNPSDQILTARDGFLARGAIERGEPRTAVTLARSALERNQEAKLPDWDRVAVELDLARALNDSGDFEAARRGALAALATARKLQDGFPHSLYSGSALAELGRALRALDRQEEANAVLRDAVENLRQCCGDAAPEARRAVELLARTGS